MTLMSGLFERRTNLENPAYPLTAATLTEVLDFGDRVDSGVSVNETNSLGISAVWRAVTMTAGVASALPLKTYKQGTRARTVVRLLDNPHPDMTPKELWETVYVHVLLWGNAYLRKVRNDAGMLTWLLPIPPSAVKVGRVRDWQNAGMLSPKVYEVTDGTSREDLTDYEILHIPGLGYDGVCGASPVRVARQSFGLAMAAESYGAKFFGSGSLMSGILQTEQRLDNDQAEAIKNRWKQKMSGLGTAHDIAVLGSGTSFQPIQMPNDDAQFLESRRFQVDEVARWFGVPPHMLFELSGSTSWGTGIEQQTIGWVVFSLQPTWLSRVEARLTKEATPPGQYAEYTLEGLLRGDSAARAGFYAATVGRPIATVNEARVNENMPPIDGGDVLWAPMNFAPVGADGFTDPATGQTTTGGDGADQAA